MDPVFKALADRSRRRLLDRLFRRDAQTLGELCERAGMTRFGVMKHLRTLEKAGLVVSRKSGREKLHYLNPMPIRLVHDRWVDKYRTPFEAALGEPKSGLKEPRTQVHELFICTTRAKLRRALTDPALTVRWFFAARPESRVLQRVRPEWLVVTWRLPSAPPAPAARVAWHIEKRGPRLCKLTATHSAAAVISARDGWQLAISALKTLLETGEPMPVPTAVR